MTVPGWRTDVVGGLAAVGPIAVQLITHQVTWPVAVGAAVTALIVYLGGLFHLGGKSVPLVAGAVGQDVTSMISRGHAGPGAAAGAVVHATAVAGQPAVTIHVAPAASIPLPAVPGVTAASVPLPAVAGHSVSTPVGAP